MKPPWFMPSAVWFNAFFCDTMEPTPGVYDWGVGTTRSAKCRLFPLFTLRLSSHLGSIWFDSTRLDKENEGERQRDKPVGPAMLALTHMLSSASLSSSPSSSPPSTAFQDIPSLGSRGPFVNSSRQNIATRYSPNAIRDGTLCEPRTRIGP
jgi:hypothetical protein